MIIRFSNQTNKRVWVSKEDKVNWGLKRYQPRNCWSIRDHVKNRSWVNRNRNWFLKRNNLIKLYKNLQIWVLIVLGHIEGIRSFSLGILLFYCSSLWQAHIFIVSSTQQCALALSAVGTHFTILYCQLNLRTCSTLSDQIGICSCFDPYFDSWRHLCHWNWPHL